MSIDEAIKYADNINKTVTFPDEYSEDEDFFVNVVNWLEELKEFKKINMSREEDSQSYICSICNNCSEWHR